MLSILNRLHFKVVVPMHDVQVLNIFDLTQIMDKPTRIIDWSISITGHNLTNRKEHLIQYETLDMGISGYLIIYCLRHISKGYFKHHYTIKVRYLKNYSPEILQEKITCECVPCFINCVNKSWKNYQKTFNRVWDEAVPVKEVRFKQRTEP